MSIFRQRNLIPKTTTTQKVFTILVVLFFTGTLTLFLTVEKEKKPIDIVQTIAEKHPAFAGEPIPFDSNHFANREKFEREFLLTRFNVAQFILYHRRSALYFPSIEAKLKAANIPDDFKYLAVAESALKNDAISDANAGGIWQFIPDTGKRFGLRIDKEIDERYDFDKATDAAIKYLTKLYGDFGNWTLVAAAYNRGETGIKKAMADQNARTYYDLLLNEETARYVFRIVAIKILMENKKEYFDTATLGAFFEAPETRNIPLSGTKDLQKTCREQGLSYSNVKLLNQWIVGNSLPDGNWTIKILAF